MNRLKELQQLAQGCSIKEARLNLMGELRSYYTIDCHKNKVALFTDRSEGDDIERIAWLKEQE